MKNPVSSPLGDPERLDALMRTGLLDSGPEPLFDRLAEVAAKQLGVPAALVTLVTDERQYFKSCIGLSGQGTPLSHSFCQYSVMDRAPLVVRDAREDDRLRDNPAIPEAGVIAYAGVPLITREGHVLGTFCAIDWEPRDWTGADVELLSALGEAVVAAIELRTEKRHHEETARSLLEKESELELVLDQLPAIVWTTDRDLRVLTARGRHVVSDALLPGGGVGMDLETALADQPAVRMRAVVSHRRALAGESVAYTTRWRDTELEIRLEPLLAADRSIRGVIGVAHDVTEWKRAEREQDEAREQLRSLIQHVSDVVALVEPEGTIGYGSPSIERMLGYTGDDLLGRHFRHFIHPDDLEETAGIFQRLLDEPESVHRWRVRLLARDGSTREVEAVARSAVHVPELRGVVFVGRDITERVEVETELKERERQLFHSQKLDAVGRLAGGVAHDFNNLLTVVAGHAEFLRTLVAGDAAVEVEGVQDAVRRAAELTRQLLTFSGERTTEPRNVELAGKVEGLAKMLRRLIGEDIELTIDLSDRGHLRIDPARLEQVIVNLVVNARDAMLPGGGQLALGVSGATLHRERFIDSGSIAAGDYLVLEVRDTGCGMDEETRSHIFEPFFTTKGTEGTGLGLATVFGIVTQAGGGIGLSTRPGEGAAFRLYFPRVTEEEGVEATAEREPVRGGSERILLVEDDNAVRRLTARSLKQAGYDVVPAGNAQEARRALERIGSVDLLVTDVIMPGESGTELVDSLGSGHADLPVLYLSGYANRKLEPHGVLDGHRRFLAKPYASHELLAAVRSALEAGREGD